MVQPASKMMKFEVSFAFRTDDMGLAYKIIQSLWNNCGYRLANGMLRQAGLSDQTLSDMRWESLPDGVREQLFAAFVREL